jgi:transcriptional regulator with XRE-family HTH domain
MCSSCHGRGAAETEKLQSHAGPWLSRAQDHEVVVADDVGTVLRGWRLANGKSQVEVAALLGMTQQHLSHIEKGKRSLSIEQRRRIVEQLGVAPEELGLASGRSRHLVARDDANKEIAANRARWRAERRWLNQHRSKLARLAVQLYPEEHRVPRSPLLVHPDWALAEPVGLRSLNLVLDEGPQTVEVNGSEAETLAVRSLRVAGAHFDRYTTAIRHLDPPRLFESRPSYRLLAASLTERRLKFGMAAYFDKLDVSEALGHEFAAACMAVGRVPDSPEELRGRLPFRDLIGDPFDLQRRAVIPAITTLTIRLRRYPAEPSFLLHWRDPERVATAAGIYGRRAGGRVPALKRGAVGSPQ